MPQKRKKLGKPKIKIRHLKPKIREITKIREKNLENEISREEFKKFSDFIKQKKIPQINVSVPLEQPIPQRQVKNLQPQEQEVEKEIPQTPRASYNQFSQQSQTYQTYGPIREIPRQNIVPVLRQEINPLERRNQLLQGNQQMQQARTEGSTEERRYIPKEEREGLMVKRKDNWNR